MSRLPDFSGIVAVANGIASSLESWRFAEGEPGYPDDGAEYPDDPELVQQFDLRINDADLVAATRSRFATEHYADAVESGVKALNQLVRDRSGRAEDGDDLMTIVFSKNGALLRLNELRSKNDESEQRGYMLLCQGVVGAWRNPRAHKLIDDEPARALMMLEVIDDLMRTTRLATRTRKKRKAKAV